MSSILNDTGILTSDTKVLQTAAHQKPKLPRSLSFNNNVHPKGPATLKSPFAIKQNRIKKEQHSRRRSNSGLTNKDAYKAKLPNPRAKSIARDSRALDRNSLSYSDDSEDLDEVDPRPRSSSHQVSSSPPSAPSSSEEKGAAVDFFPQISMGLQQKYLELKSDMAQLEEKTKGYEAELDLIQNSKTINQLSELRSQMESVLFSSETFANSASSSFSKSSPRFSSLKNTYRPITPSFFRPPSSNADSRPQSPTPYLPGRITQNLLVDLQNITELGSKLVAEVSELKSKAENEVSKRSRTEAKLHQLEDKLVYFSALEEKLRQNQEDLWKECQVNEKHSALRHELESHVNVLLNHEKAYKAKIEANNEEIERLRLDIQALKGANSELQSKFDLESTNHRKSMVSSARESRLLQEKIRTLEKEISDFHKVKPLTLVHETFNPTAPERSPSLSPETPDHSEHFAMSEEPIEVSLPPLNYNSEALDEKNSRLVKTLARSDAAKKRYKKKVDEQQKLLEQYRIKIHQLMEGAVSHGPSEDEAWDLNFTQFGPISGSDCDSLSEVEKSPETKLLPTGDPILNSGVEVTQSRFINPERGQFSGSGSDSDSSQGKSIRRARLPHRRPIAHSPPPSDLGESMNDLQSQLLEKTTPLRKITRKLRRSRSRSRSISASSANRPSTTNTFATELAFGQSSKASPNSAISKIAELVASDFTTKPLDYNHSPISPIPESLAPEKPSLNSNVPENVPELSEAEVKAIAQKIIKELRESYSPSPVPASIGLDCDSSPIPRKLIGSPDKTKPNESDSALSSSLLFSDLNPATDFCSTQTTFDSKPASSIEHAVAKPSITEENPKYSEVLQTDSAPSHLEVNIVPLVSLMMKNPTFESRSQLHQVLQILKTEPTLQPEESDDLDVSQVDASIQTFDDVANSKPTTSIERNIVDVGVQCSLQKSLNVTGHTTIVGTFSSHSTTNPSELDSTLLQNVSVASDSNHDSPVGSHNKPVHATLESKSSTNPTVDFIEEEPHPDDCGKEMAEPASSTQKIQTSVQTSVQTSGNVDCPPSLLESKPTLPVDLCHAIKCLDSVEATMTKFQLGSDSPIIKELCASLSQLRQFIQASQEKPDAKNELACPTLLLSPETLRADDVISIDPLSNDGLSERNGSNPISHEVGAELFEAKSRPSSRRSFSSQLSNFFQNSSFNKSRVGPGLQREGSTHRKPGQDSDGSVKDLVTLPSSTSASLVMSPSMRTPEDHIVLSMVHAMSGEFLHKFVRKTTFSTETVHLRFFWLNPYTRVLAWARREPHFALGTRSPRQVYVTKVEEIQSSYRHPTMSEDCTRAINIHTTSRVITVKANSMAYHEMWYTALSRVQSHNTQQSSKYCRERHWNSIKSKDSSLLMASDARSAKTSLLSRPSSRAGSYSSARRDAPDETIRSASPIYSLPEEMSGADLVSIRVSRDFVRAPKTESPPIDSHSGPSTDSKS